MDKVSVILVNYNNSEDTIHCLNSLIKQNYPDITIIVVDNSENEKYINDIFNSLKSMKYQVLKVPEEKSNFIELKFSKDIILIKAKENKGFSGGNNIGIKLALKNSSDYIWILNNDTEVKENTLEILIRTSQTLNSSVTTCKIIDFYERDKIQFCGEFVDYDGTTEKQDDKVKKPFVLSGCNLFINSKVFEKTGLLDEDYFLYFEDNDFHFKLLKNKIPYIYTSSTKIYHKGGSSIGKFFNTPLSAYYGTRNSFLIIKKTKEGKYQNSLNESCLKFFKYQKDKKIIRGIILGIYDFIQGKIGKQEYLDHYLNIKPDKSEINLKEDLEKLYKKYPTNINLNKILAEKYKDNPEKAIKYIFMLTLLYPRKKEYYEKFFQIAESILKKLEEKRNEKSISLHN